MSKPRVGLFVTCLVDFFRPSVGFASVALLERAGCDVEVPLAQSCCGQPAFNAGDRAAAARIARQMVETFERFDHVVLPSGSCAAQIARDYPDLLADDPAYADRARALAARTHEITSFLADVMGMARTDAALSASATYHDSCTGLRALGVKAQPRALLAGVEGLSLREMREPETCCGFGGAFCVKFPDISTRMVSDKCADIAETGAELLLAGDLGCLLNMAGRARREGRDFRARHVVEVLAGMTDAPAIGEEA